MRWRGQGCTKISTMTFRMAIGDKVLIFNVQVQLKQQTHKKFDEIGFDAAAVTTKVLDLTTKFVSSPSDIKATPTLSAPLFRSVNWALWLCSCAKCSNHQEDKPWCSTWTDSSDQHMSGHWGFCAPVEQVGASLILSRHWPGTSHFHGHNFQELAQSTFSNTTHSCTESDFHICRAPSNYGFIEVSFHKAAAHHFLSSWTSAHFFVIS